MALSCGVFCSCDNDDVEENSSSENIVANLEADELLEKTVKASSDVVDFRNVELFKKGKEKCRMSGKATVNMTYSITPLYFDMRATLLNHNYALDSSAGMSLLSLVSQKRKDDDPTSFTQWSALYNLSEKSVRLAILREYGRIYNFKVE